MALFDDEETGAVLVGVVSVARLYGHLLTAWHEILAEVE